MSVSGEAFVSKKRKNKQACGLCGKDPAAGFASIDDVRYCHGDDDPEPTCYMRSQGRYLDPVEFRDWDWRL